MSVPRDLHAALRTEQVAEANGAGVAFKIIKLTYGKNDNAWSLHAHPQTFSTAGFQTPDLLGLSGFARSACPFFQGECYVREIQGSFQLEDFARSFQSAVEAMKAADHNLQVCGIALPAPDGLKFFFGQAHSGGTRSKGAARGDGHSGPDVTTQKATEDDYFLFRLTAGELSDGKGWVFHYRPKNPPLSLEIRSALEFLGGFQEFEECPEFDFEPCRWRFVRLEGEGDRFLESNAGWVHAYFDRHADWFSKGLERLLYAHACLAPFGVSFLPQLTRVSATARPRGQSVSSRVGRVAAAAEPDTSTLPSTFDVALSFAGTERASAEALAHLVQQAGYKVFYDNFFPEHLWGKDLVTFFDEIYRKKARYCVIFVSNEYLLRPWTNHERQSAQARALEERGEDYILPIQIDDTELPGLPPTIGYLSLGERSIEVIADLLVKKLRSSAR